MLGRTMLKRTVAFFFIFSVTLLVSADCQQSCKEEYEDCMSMGSSVRAHSVCGSILRECNLECGMNGE